MDLNNVKSCSPTSTNWDLHNKSHVALANLRQAYEKTILKNEPPLFQLLKVRVC